MSRIVEKKLYSRVSRDFFSPLRQVAGLGLVS